jgi:hypothetical protein
LKRLRKQIAIAKHAIIVANWIAHSVDAASKVNPQLQILHIIQLAKEKSANENHQSNRSNVAMHHAFITKKGSILGS